MTVQAEHINPTMETSFMEIEVRARDRLRPVDAVLPKRPLDGASGKRQRRGDFDFKGKARAELRAAIAIATPPPPVEPSHTPST